MKWCIAALGLASLLVIAALKAEPTADFDQMLDGLLKGSVPFVSVEDLNAEEEGVILLDARPEKEYRVSHLKGAKRIGYRDFKVEELSDLSRDQPVVVYCSVGYRSEKIGEKLQAMGFQNVRNLRGGIFQWFNEGLPVYSDGQEVKEVHPYDRHWGKWLKPTHPNP